MTFGNSPSPMLNTDLSQASETSSSLPEYDIKSTDMSEKMQQESIELAQEAMSLHSIQKDIAHHIKREFDFRKGPTWHCVVGRDYGSYVTHETRHFIYVYFHPNQTAVLLFKTQ